MSTINVNVVQSTGGTVTINDNLIVTGTNNIRPYKVYTAIINQGGTNPPNTAILENTIGTVSWGRTQEGFYTLTSSGLFVQYKTSILNSISNANTQVITNWVDVNTIYVYTFTSAGALQDGVMNNTTFEVRVYD